MADREQHSLVTSLLAASPVRFSSRSSATISRLKPQYPPKGSAGLAPVTPRRSAGQNPSILRQQDQLVSAPVTPRRSAGSKPQYPPRQDQLVSVTPNQFVKTDRNSESPLLSKSKNLSTIRLSISKSKNLSTINYTYTSQRICSIRNWSLSETVRVSRLSFANICLYL